LLNQDKLDKRLFEAAFAKRNAPYGKGGPGGIYVTKNTTTTLFATVPNAGGRGTQTWGAPYYAGNGWNAYLY
ncbi:hypothetical protein ACFQ1S_43525, partial [Kibdelosporangium lantanae]